jgi:predicted PolB exonuclease-like 3'-5' exonuclease
MHVTIDIETISVGPKKDPRDFSPPGNYTKKESIDAWYESHGQEEVEKEFRRRALIPHKCQMVCWALTTDGEVLRSGCDKEISEVTLLEIMSLILPELVHSPYEITWVGANIRNFDLVILKQRAWKYGFDWLAKAFSQTQVFDLIDVFTGSRSKDYLVGKDEMCKFFGIENGDDVDGSQVQDLYDAGEYDKIVQHCVADVKKEYELYQKMS